MASPVADQYSGASGGSIVGGRSSVRPVLGAIGHSKVNYEITADSGYGMSGLAHHKWLNALLRKPFDYVRCNVPASTMGPGWTASNLVNGFYGRGGAPAVSVLGGTPPGVPTYIDQIEELVGNRRALICINAESNTLYAGTSAASGHACWATYESMLALFAAKGWKTAVSEPVASTSFNTAGNNAAALAFREDCLTAGAAGATINLTGMYNSFLDPAAANGYLQPLAGYTLDGTHLSFQGALKLGLAFADNFPKGLYDPWRPRETDVVCSQNPTLAGTSGTKGSNASGVVPNGFSLDWYGTGRSVTGTQTDDGYELYFQYTGGNYTDSYGLDFAATAFLANVEAGVTELEGLCDVEILEAVNMGCTLIVNTGVNSAAAPAMLNTFDSGQINWASWVVGRRLVLHTDPFLAPVGITRASASLRAYVKIFSATARLRVRVRWIGVKRTG